MVMLSPNQVPVPAVAPTAPTAPPPATATPAGQSIEGLRVQLGDLNVQLAGLRAEWRGLQDQLNSMLKTNPARPAVVAKWADVGVQIAHVEGDVARLQTQIAQKQGTPVAGVPVPASGRRTGPDPDMIVGMSFVLLLAVILPTSIAYAKRVWRGQPPPQRNARDDLAAQRMERMEHAVDAIAIEIERVSEGQRFVTKVLAERMPVAAKPGVESAEQQSRALGAGPIEPIRVPEREAVRPSITPR
jgi:hypothetical protein